MAAVDLHTPSFLGAVRATEARSTGKVESDNGGLDPAAARAGDVEAKTHVSGRAASDSASSCGGAGGPSRWRGHRALVG